MPASAQRALIAEQSLLADARGRAHDVGDAPVPEREQVLGRKTRTHAVVDLHERHGRRLDVAVEADDREPVLDEARDPLGREHEPVHERAVDVLGTQESQVALLLLGIEVGRAQQHRVAALERELVDAGDELGVEGIRDVGQQQRDRLRRARDEAARDRVGPVAELLDGRVDREPLGAGHLARCR